MSVTSRIGRSLDIPAEQVFASAVKADTWNEIRKTLSAHLALDLRLPVPSRA
jgi:hypothetical protein